ncbi:MAG: S-methyl-5-thioribose-1-phosphate isomerase [Desulfurococcales archaeon ex4484_204]|nr:MAG: S-methyl-5-thioribose-1-phosphate isomerase [Desulfurococcales archaeon ex4484_204]
MGEVAIFEWLNGKLRWLNTLKLPLEEEFIESGDPERVARAIETMEIRGAPAIGVAAAFGVALAALSSKAKSVAELRRDVLRAIERFKRTRPTAVNLFWALKRMESVAMKEYGSLSSAKEALVGEALRIFKEDLDTNLRISEFGKSLINDGDTVLTHCNAGALATAGYGTALGVIRSAWREGKKIKVIATETRPVLQGARLTVWELVKEGIPVTLITDSMVGYVMSRGLVDKVVVGADRILLTGHVINKIGTYTIAVIASKHDVPLYVAAPTSTIDSITSVNEVVIEERDPNEVRYVLGKLLITVPSVNVMNPAFDITPPDLVTAIITEKGIARKPFSGTLPKLLR